MGSNPQSFTDLLNQTYPPATPPFCTQPNNAGSSPHAPDVVESSPEVSREPRRRWTINEDGALVSAWLNTSKDVIVGNDQRAGSFWRRVAAYYAASDAVKDLPKRDWGCCKQRWGKINQEVLRFSGCYAEAERKMTSGQSEDDTYELAYKLYAQGQRTNFTLEHVWRVLRHDHKWCSLVKDKGKSNAKRARLAEEGTQSSNAGIGVSMEDQTVERPIGVKAAKAKGKRVGKATTEDREASLKALDRVWMLKEKDYANKEIEFANRDRMYKMKLLDKLLGKTEPLSEIDTNLKMKLISELF